MVSSSKSTPLRSPVWEYFKIVGERRVCCMLCVPPATTILCVCVCVHACVRLFVCVYQLFGIRSLRKQLFEQQKSLFVSALAMTYTYIALYHSRCCRSFPSLLQSWKLVYQKALLSICLTILSTYMYVLQPISHNATFKQFSQPE